MKLRKTGTRIPVVLSKGETQRVINQLEETTKVPKKTDGKYGLPAKLQYGAGLRRSELVRLRIKDIDLDRGTLTIRQAKGDKDCLGRLLRLPRPSGNLSGWLSHALPPGIRLRHHHSKNAS